jgi:hypothetical protein
MSESGQTLRKNRATILREAEEATFARGLVGREQEFLDSLHVMEVGMRHFFAKAMHAKANKGKPETIDANMLQAVSIAEKIAPYRHAQSFARLRKQCSLAVLRVASRNFSTVCM